MRAGGSPQASDQKTAESNRQLQEMINKAHAQGSWLNDELIDQVRARGTACPPQTERQVTSGCCC